MGLLVPLSLRGDRAAGGAVERGALAVRVVGALAAADLSHRDGPESIGRLAGAARRAIPGRGPGRPAAGRAQGERMDRSRPGRADDASGPSPRSPTFPSSVLIKERTAEGKVEERRDVASRGRRVSRSSFPPSASSSTIDLAGGDDWLGPLHGRAGRPPVARRDEASRQGARRHLRADFEPSRTRGSTCCFLPDTEVELTLVGNEPISESQVKIQAGKTLPLSRSDEPHVHRDVEAQRGDDARDPADLGQDGAGLEARRSSRSVCSRTGSRGSRCGPWARRPCHADRDDSAFDQRDRRFRAGRSAAAESTGPRAPTTSPSR